MISKPLVSSIIFLSIPRAINGFVFQSSSFLTHVEDSCIATTSSSSTAVDSSSYTMESLSLSASASSELLSLIIYSPSIALSISSIPDAFLDPLFYQHVATGGALALAGDIIAQSLLSEQAKRDNQLSFPPKDWDKVRTAAFVVFGAFYTGGAQHFIFDYLNTNFDEPLKRLALAQFFFIPFCYYPTFLVMTPTLRAGWEYGFGGTTQSAFRERQMTLVTEVAQKIPSTLVRNWMFWLPVQFVQFNYVPVDLNVTFTATFGVIWNAILSWSTAASSSSSGSSKQEFDSTVEKKQL